MSKHSKKLEQMQSQGIFLEKEINLASSYVCLNFLSVISKLLKIYQHFMCII